MQISVTNTIDAKLTDLLTQLFARSVPPEQQDDRFDRWPPDSGPTAPFTAALATDADRSLVGYLGGGLDQGRLRLDALVARSEPEPTVVLTDLIDAIWPATAWMSPTTVELWARPALPYHGEAADAAGFVPARVLHQMRCPLPVDVEAIPTRAFDPERDLEALLLVNNRAFVDHPDQGGQSLEGLAAQVQETWFEAAGLRIHERDGRMVGFCWTKIHPAHPDRGPAVGEIYVIGVDPDFHGSGLGAPMTAAGLHWLHQKGLETGMLYVEAGNTPAVRTYERLGFRIVRTDRAWAHPGPAGSEQPTSPPPGGAEVAGPS